MQYLWISSVKQSTYFCKIANRVKPKLPAKQMPLDRLINIDSFSLAGKLFFITI
jgi:hypothetical protein